MDKLNLFLFGEKQKEDEYIKEAEKAANIVYKGVENYEFSELTQELDTLPSTGISRDRYVFDRPKSIIYTLMICFCLIMSVVFFCILLISIGTLVYSDKFNSYAIGGTICALAIIFLNSIIVVYSISKIRFYKRYDIYLNVLRFRNIEIIDDLAAYSNTASERLVKDLASAVKMKLIPQGHFGKDNLIFIVSNEIYENYKEKQAVYDRYYRKLVEERLRMKERSKEMEAILNQGQQYIDKIHESNDIIKDKLISQKLDRMEKVVSMIFHEVDINPAQDDKLGMFMNYYLPTTEKLLEAYIEIDEKQVKGKTLERTKKDIECALDKIIDSFEGLLDKFYQEQEMDITSDISAMEIIMKQEGLID